MEKIKIELNVEPITPYSVDDVEKNLLDDLEIAAREIGIPSNEINQNILLTFERRLPTPDQLETLKCVLEIGSIVGPLLIKLVEKIIKSLKKKYGKVQIIYISINNHIIEIMPGEDNFENIIKYLLN